MQGTWYSSTDPEGDNYIFSDDGTFVRNNIAGNWSVTDETLILSVGKVAAKATIGFDDDLEPYFLTENGTVWFKDKNKSINRYYDEHPDERPESEYEEEVTEEEIEESDQWFIVDNDDCFSEEEEISIQNSIQEKRSWVRYDIVVATDNIPGAPADDMKEAIEKFYKECDFGIGESKAGLLLFYNSGDKITSIYLMGDAISLYSEEELDWIKNNINHAFSQGRCMDAVNILFDNLNYL